MPQRISSTEKWRDPWFRKLPPTYKCFFEFICDECNHAGIWNVDLELAEYLIGDKLDIEHIKRLFEGRIMMKGDYWWVPRFMTIQYGDKLNKGNAVKTAVQLIESRGFGEIAKRILGDPYERVKGGLANPPSTAMATATAIAKAKVVTKTQSEKTETAQKTSTSKVQEWFEVTWKNYPKERRVEKKAALRSYQKYVKNLDDAKAVARALENYLKTKTVQDGFVKNASTFFSNWEDYRDDSRASSTSTYCPPTEPQATSFDVRERGATESQRMLLELGNSKRFP